MTKTTIPFAAFPVYRAIVDGLSEMIEEGRLSEADCPDDFKWLCDRLEELTGLDPVQELGFIGIEMINEQCTNAGDYYFGRVKGAGPMKGMVPVQEVDGKTLVYVDPDMVRPETLALLWSVQSVLFDRGKAAGQQAQNQAIRQLLGCAPSGV